MTLTLCWSVCGGSIVLLSGAQHEVLLHQALFPAVTVAETHGWACGKGCRSIAHVEACGKVYHAESCLAAAGIMQPRAKGAIFLSMPGRIKLKTMFSCCCAKSPKAIVEPAVPDPEIFGYAGLYATILDHVSMHCNLNVSLNLAHHACWLPACTPSSQHLSYTNHLCGCTSHR